MARKPDSTHTPDLGLTADYDHAQDRDIALRFAKQVGIPEKLARLYLAELCQIMCNQLYHTGAVQLSFFGKVKMAMSYHKGRGTLNGACYLSAQNILRFSFRPGTHLKVALKERYGAKEKKAAATAQPAKNHPPRPKRKSDGRRA